jgi:predicted nucleotidyltransferase
MLSPAQKKIITEMFVSYNPLYLGVFGSYARNEENKNSDLDILFDSSQPLNLLDIIGIEQDLSDKLAIKVDLVTLQSVPHQLMPYIQKDLINLL